MNFRKSDFSGGIARMWIVPFQYFKGVSFDPSSGLFKAPGLRDVLIEVPFSIDTGSYRVTSNNNAYDTEISAFIPGISANNIQASIDLETGPFIVVLQDYNGNFILLGSHQDFFLYETDFEAKEDISVRAGFNFSISKLMMFPPFFIMSVFENSLPVASNVKIEGIPKLGETLTGTYVFSDADNDEEDGSIYRWYLAEEESGSNKTIIESENTQTLEILDEYMNQYIFFSVEPSDGIDYGEEVFSNPVSLKKEEVIIDTNTLYVSKKSDNSIYTTSINEENDLLEIEFLQEFNGQYDWTYLSNYWLFVPAEDLYPVFGYDVDIKVSIDSKKIKLFPGIIHGSWEDGFPDNYTAGTTEVEYDYSNYGTWQNFKKLQDYRDNYMGFAFFIGRIDDAVIPAGTIISCRINKLYTIE